MKWMKFSALLLHASMLLCCGVGKEGWRRTFTSIVVVPLIRGNCRCVLVALGHRKIK